MPDYVGSIHAELAHGLPMSIAETGAFSSQCRGVLTGNEVAEIKIDLATNPTSGVLMEGTGGVRKYRYGYGHRGKRGGVRIIYYFHDRDMPIYLLAIYKKSEKIDLNEVEKAAMRKLTRELRTAYRARHMPKMIS